MSVGQALNNALSGLSASGRRAGVVSNNIANAQTEGFAARTVKLDERVTGGVGAGVNVSGISRASAPAVTAERRIADGEAAFYNETAKALDNLTRLIGGPEDANSLARRFANFETSLSQLADAPDDAILQSNGVSDAKSIASSLNELSSSLQRIRTQADSQIFARVTETNDALRKIEQLNGAISRGQASNGEVNALIDQRAKLIDQVNRNIPIRVINTSSGIDLITPEGAFLLSGSARPIVFTSTPSITPSAVYAGGAGILSGIFVDGIDITPGGGGVSSLQKGAIAGLFSVRDEAGPELSSSLDSLALDIAERFSANDLDPTTPSGAPGLFSDNGTLATSVNLTGLAGRLSVNASADPDLGGDPRVLRDGLGAVLSGPVGKDTQVRAFLDALTALRIPPIGLQSSSALSAAQAAVQVSSLTAETVVKAEEERDISSVYAASLLDAELGQVGVDTDSELQKLLRIEQAYAANVRVIQTVDRLLQRLLEI